MAVGGIRVATASPRAGLTGRVRELFDREGVLGPLFVTPALIILLLLVAYPFAMALYFALSNAFIGRPSHLVGLRNFINLWDSDAFRQTFQNAFVFTGIAVKTNAFWKVWRNASLSHRLMKFLSPTRWLGRPMKAFESAK